MAFKDLRRTDARVPVNSEPFWFSSAIFGAESDDFDAVLKSFTALDGTYQILSAGVEIITPFDGSTTLTVGHGTMLTDTIGTVTAVDVDQFIMSADVTEATAGYYPASAAATNAFNVATAAGLATIIKGKDAVVPVIYLTLTGTPTVGAGRVHMLLTKVPVA